MKLILRFLLAGALLLVSPVFSKSSTPLDLASLASKRAVLKTSSGVSGPLIVLDAGHGGADDGAQVGHLLEKKINLLTVLYTKKQLEELGYRVLLTRKKDTYISLPKRVSMANQTKSAVFASIHCNAAPNPDAQGLEIYYHRSGPSDKSASSSKLAEQILAHIVGQTGCISRGVKPGRFYVIRETVMPSILVEIGFLTNREERSNMRKKSYLDKVAKGIAQGINAYIKSEKTLSSRNY